MYTIYYKLCYFILRHIATISLYKVTHAANKLPIQRCWMVHLQILPDDWTSLAVRPLRLCWAGVGFKN